jgi:hypothetical protein
MLHFGVVDKPAARAGFVLLMFASMAGFIAIRIHYSVDVALAFVIALLIFGYGRMFYDDASKTSLRGTTLFHMLILSQALAFFSVTVNVVSTENDVRPKCDTSDDCSNGAVCVDKRCVI